MVDIKKITVARKKIEEQQPFEPVVTGKDDRWFIIPMLVAFVAFAAWRLAQ